MDPRNEDDILLALKHFKTISPPKPAEKVVKKKAKAVPVPAAFSFAMTLDAFSFESDEEACLRLRARAQSISTVAMNNFETANKFQERELFMHAIPHYDWAIRQALDAQKAWIECEEAHKVVSGRDWGKILKNKFLKRSLIWKASYIKALSSFQSQVIRAVMDNDSSHLKSLCQRLVENLQETINWLSIGKNNTTTDILPAILLCVEHVCVWLGEQRKWSRKRPTEALLERIEELNIEKGIIVQQNIVKLNSSLLLQVIVIKDSDTEADKSVVVTIADHVLIHLENEAIVHNLTNCIPEKIVPKYNLYRLKILEFVAPYFETMRSLFKSLNDLGLAGCFEFDLLFEKCGGPSSKHNIKQWNLMSHKKFGIKPPKDLYTPTYLYLPEKPIVVAVLDTGIHKDNDDLRDVVLDNEFPCVPGLHSLHGTHVAGIIGAAWNSNDKHGVFGVAGRPGIVNLLSCNVFDQSGYAMSSTVVEAIVFSLHNNAKIFNCSFCCSHLTDVSIFEHERLLDNINLENAFLEASEMGVISVVAAGNDGYDNDKVQSFPSEYARDQKQRIIVVAATNKDGKLGEWQSKKKHLSSNYGKATVHLCAPGINIWSTAIDSTDPVPRDGTSMAAPHVSGALALLMVKFLREENETLAEYAKRLMSKLFSSATELNLAPKGVLYGLLNLSEALKD